ncbi:hypothetical protein O6P43_033790, partial [Quillaja saponaria]
GMAEFITRIYSSSKLALIKVPPRCDRGMCRNNVQRKQTSKISTDKYCQYDKLHVYITIERNLFIQKLTTHIKIRIPDSSLPTPSTLICFNNSICQPEKLLINTTQSTRGLRTEKSSYHTFDKIPQRKATMHPQNKYLYNPDTKGKSDNALWYQVQLGEAPPPG